MASANILELTDATFQDQIKSPGVPMVVDFWAPWCPPCRALAPVVEELAGEMAGKVQFAKLNTDDHPTTPNALGIRGIPTLIIFRGGKEIGRIVGALAKGDLQTKIEETLSPQAA